MHSKEPKKIHVMFPFAEELKWQGRSGDHSFATKHLYSRVCSTLVEIISISDAPGADAASFAKVLDAGNEEAVNRAQLQILPRKLETSYETWVSVLHFWPNNHDCCSGGQIFIYSLRIETTISSTDSGMKSWKMGHNLEEHTTANDRESSHGK